MVNEVIRYGRRAASNGDWKLIQPPVQRDTLHGCHGADARLLSEKYERSSCRLIEPQVEDTAQVVSGINRVQSLDVPDQNAADDQQHQARRDLTANEQTAHTSWANAAGEGRILAFSGDRQTW
jgi:hypothetical protein